MAVDRIRSFFAIPLSHASEDELAAVADGLRASLQQHLPGEVRWRWVASANYHLTLAFLGNIRRRDIEQLHQIALHSIEGMVASDFYLQRLAWFPSALKPRMLVAVPQHCEALVELQQRLSRGLRREGYAVEKREFRPHVTLARLQGLFEPADLSAEAVDIFCELDELVLFSSVQGRGGAEYSPLLVEPIGQV